MAIFHGTKHDDNLTGGSGDDAFELFKGGEDTASGGGGDDVFNMGASLDAGDRLDGGSGRDLVTIHGDYSAGLVFQDQTIQNIEALRLGNGFDYKLTMADGNVAAGAFLSVYANALGAAYSLTFDGSAETDGHYLVTGGAGNDVITGGAQADKFHLEDGGNDTVHGGGGDDVFAMGAALTAADTVDGGTGNDTLVLNGTYFAGTALVLGAATITNIETIAFDGNHSYSVTTNDGNVGSGDTLTVDASANGSGLVIFNGSAEQDGSFHFIAGPGTNEFTGGAGNDVFDLTQGGSSGHQTEGNGGNDVFNVGADLAAYIAGGTSAGIDGGAGSDTLNIDGVYAGTVVLAVAASPIRNVETVTFGAGDSYTVQVANDIAGGSTLTIDASAASNISIDLTAATSAAYVITGSAGDDTIKGANAATTFHLEAGGNDTVTGGSANDVFYLGGALTAADAIDGGGGTTNTLVLDGDYSAGLTFGATTVTNVQTIQFAAGHDYDITLNAATVSLFNLTVDGSNLGAGDSLTLDASAAGRPVTLIGGAGDDVLTGGPVHNTFDISHGGDDIVHTNGGTGSVRGGAAFTAADTIFGSGFTTLELNGDYSAGVTTTHVTGVSEIVADQGHSYDITLAAATVTAGNQLQVASNSGNFDGSDSLTVDASQIGGSVRFESQFASSDFTGGSGDDTIIVDYVGQSANTLHGGGGDDVFNLGGGSVGADDFIDGDAGNDTLELLPFSGLSSGNVTGIDTLVIRGNGAMAGAITGDITGGKGVLTIEVDNLSSVHLDLSAATSAGYSISMPGTGPGTFVFAGNFSASDVVDGGGSDDTLELSGDYSAGLTFGATTIAAIDTIKLDDGFSYKLTMNANDTAGNTQTIDASALGATHTLTFDGSAEANSILVKFGAGFTAADSVIGGSGSDTLQFNGDYASLTLSTAQAGSIETLTFLGNHSYTGVTVTGDIAGGSTLTIDASAAGNLSIDLSAATSAAYAITGSGGNDTIKFGGNFSASDSVNGGAGSDTLEINGDYSAGLTLGATTVTNTETIKVDDGHSYDLVSNDGNVASGATLTVDASALTGSNQLFFNGSNETDGHFAFIGGAGDDDLEGGAQSDTFDLSRSDGAFAFGNGGNDIFTVVSAAKFLDDSIDGGAGSDTLILNGDFSTQTTITASNVENIEALTLQGAANSYNLVLGGGGVEGAGTFTIDASTASSLAIDVSGATSSAYVITGSAGADTFKFGSNFSAADTVDGGAGNDTLQLNGDYSAGLTFGASTIANIETLKLSGGSYTIVTNDNNVGPGDTLTVDATALTTAQTLAFDGSAETNGNFTFKFAANFTAADTITGGAGNDTLSLNGNYTIALSDTAISSVETLEFDSHRVNLSITGDIAGGSTLNIDNAALLNLDLSAATSSAYAITGAGQTNVTFGGNFSASDVFRNSTGSGNLILDGDYSGGLTLSDTHLSGLDDVTFEGAFSYAVSVVGNTGVRNLSSQVSAGHTVSLDMSQATGGAFEVVQAGAGVLTTKFAGNFFNGDIVIRGALELDGDYSSGLTFVTFGGGAKTLISVQSLKLDDGFSYKLTMAEDNAGTALTADASALTGGHTLTFDGSGDSSSLAIAGGAGGDTIIGGTGADTITGGLGADTLTGGGGADIFNYAAASESNSAAYDTLTDLTTSDSIHVAGVIPAYFGAETVSAYQGSLDADLASALSGMTAGEYSVVTLTGSTDPLHGHTFLVVDGNGTAGYTADADYVIDITNFSGDPSLIHFI